MKNTIEYFVKQQLAMHSTIFKTRFDVLSHMFATSGNGIELDRYGFIANVDDFPNVQQMSPDELRYFLVKRSGGMKPLIRDHMSTRELAATVFKVSIQEIRDCVHFEEYYHTEPSYVNVYAWSDNEEFRPYMKIAACIAPDFEEQVEYFMSVIKNTDPNSLTVDDYHKYIRHGMPMHDSSHIGFYQNEHDLNMKDLVNWKNNLHIMRRDLGL